ncbi:aspartate/glutamate racemase family protein [bacterium]|nr:aspartate/glutamate racemase family protein [bacterium]
MRTIAAIYTGVALVKPLSDQLKEALPGFRIMNILDDSLIAEIIAEGRLTPAVRRRLYSYYDAAASAGAELILNTCSSIGDAVYAAREFIPVPIVRIDEAMARRAVAEASRIAVLATLSTTLDPTISLVKRCAAEAGKTVTAISAVAEGAFPAITAGDAATHDRLVAETAKKVAEDCDVILLAQGSMARMEAPLRELTGKTVYSSPRLAIETLKKMLEAGN